MKTVSLFVVCLAVFVVGCTPEASLTPVRGTVFLGDKPAKGSGYVTFHPNEKKGNNALEEGVGTLQPDGSYTLETRGKPGIAPGWYKVGVSVAEVLDPANPYVTKWLMSDPDKYTNWNLSGIEIEVVAKPVDGQYDLKLPPFESAEK